MGMVLDPCLWYLLIIHGGKRLNNLPVGAQSKHFEEDNFQGHDFCALRKRPMSGCSRRDRDACVVRLQSGLLAESEEKSQIGAMEWKYLFVALVFGNYNANHFCVLVECRTCVEVAALLGSISTVSYQKFEHIFSSFMMLFSKIMAKLRKF